MLGLLLLLDYYIINIKSKNFTLMAPVDYLSKSLTCTASILTPGPIVVDRAIPFK